MKTFLLTLLASFSLLSCFSQFSDSSELIIKLRREYKHITFADIDQDGDDDILAGSLNEIYFLENDGAGNFAPAVLLLTVNDYLKTFTVEDVNSDGLLDLIIFHFRDAGSIYKIEIWGNTGGLNFNLETSFVAPTGAGSNPFAYVDIDNDGVKELITSAPDYLGIKIFKHTSGFNFTLFQSIALQNGFVVGDVNNDGWPDIVGGAGAKFRVALNDGTGHFPTLSAHYGSGFPFTSTDSEVQLLDYNGDNNLDVVHLVHGDNKIFLFGNDGSGNFSLVQTIASSGSPISNLTKRDFDSDGFMDIAWKTNVTVMGYVPGEVKAMLGNGTGFGPVQTLSNNPPGLPYMCFSDNIGNGVDNILLFGGKESLRRFSVAGTTAPGVYDNANYLETIFYAPTSNMQTADFNGDGFIDFAAPPLFYMNQGDGTFAQHYDSTLMAANKIASHGDFNNDGIIDLVGYINLPNNKKLGYWLGLPGGGYGPFNSIGNDFIDNIGVHDINGDGWLDIFYTNKISSTNPKLYMVINQGGNGFTRGEYFGGWGSNNLSRYHPLIDFTYAEKDSVWDKISFAYIINEQISVSINDNLYPHEIGVTADHLQLGDIDGDGYIDILYIRYSDGIGWVKNEGNNVFTDQGIIQPLGTCPRPILKDLDNDNDLDILFQIEGNPNIYWLESIGYGEFAPPVLLVTDSKPGPSAGSKFQYAEDLDNDGDIDIAFIKSSPLGVSQHYGDMYTIENLLVGSNEISGFVFNDKNQNKIWDTNESALSNLPVSLNLAATDYSGQDGHFLFSPHDDNYLVEFPVPQGWSLSTDSVNYTVSVSSLTPVADSLNFGLSPNTLMYDSEVELVGAFPRCNSVANIWLGVRNTGTLPASGILELITDDSLTYVGAVIPPDSIVGDSYFWSYDSLDMFSYTNVNLSVLLPDFQSMGDTITSILINHITDSSGVIISSTSDTLKQIVVCGYDPNDKAVEPAGISDQGYIPVSESTLEYLVRFQNTGNDTVFKTRIEDQIHSNLDISTLKILAFSHPMTTKITATNQVIFEFDNILLPDSSVNFLASQGFVKFSIDQMPGLIPGDQMVNRADIYFDSNPSIVTNLTTNTIFNCDDLIDNISSISSAYCIEDTISFEAELEFGDALKWYVNGDFISDSTTLDFLGSSTNDTIRIVSTNAYCIQDSIWIVHVDTLVNPDLMLNDSIHRCEGEIATLLSNYTLGNSWIHNGFQIGTSPTFDASTTGTYILKVQNGACWNADTVYIDFHPIPIPVISNANIALDSLALCLGDSLQIDSNYPTGNTWFFNGNQISSDSLTFINQEGIYELHTTNGYCSNFGKDSIQVTPLPLPVPQLVIDNDQTLVSTVPFAQVFWLDCNDSMNYVPHQFGQIFTPDSAGSYALQVVNEEGCIGITDCYDIGYLDIEDLSYQNISIVPNPASEKLYIKGLEKALYVTLTDETGRKVLEVLTANEVNISALPEGVYFVSFTLKNRHIVKKVIIVN